MIKKTIISFLLLAAIQSHAEEKHTEYVEIAGPKSVKIGDKNGEEYWLQYPKDYFKDGKVKPEAVQSTEWRLKEPTDVMKFVPQGEKGKELQGKLTAEKSARFATITCEGISSRKDFNMIVRDCLVRAEN